MDQCSNATQTSNRHIGSGDANVLKRVGHVETCDATNLLCETRGKEIGPNVNNTFQPVNYVAIGT